MVTIRIKTIDEICEIEGCEPYNWSFPSYNSNMKDLFGTIQEAEYFDDGLYSSCGWNFNINWIELLDKDGISPVDDTTIKLRRIGIYT